MKRLDLTNKVFGKLTAVECLGKEWRCTCSCGSEVAVVTGQLTHGKTKSCGCLRKENATPLTNLVGRKIGRLFVVKLDDKIGRKGSGNVHYWICQCECGNTKSIPHHSLMKSRATQSCGCLHKEQLVARSTKPNAGFNKVYRSYVNRCRTYNIDFDVSVDEFYEMTQQRCKYCNAKPERISKAWAGHIAPFVYNGVDRVDSTLGYSKDNCVPCCSRCNYAKGDMSLDSFKDWLRTAYLHMFESKRSSDSHQDLS